MSDRHPTRATLEGFLLGSLPAHETKAVVTHLMGGCQPCRESLAPLRQALFFANPEDPVGAEISPELDHAYDEAITAAYTVALEKAASLRREHRAAPPGAEGLPRPGEAGFATPGVCEALLERSYAVRLSDPESMLRLAEWAALAAEGLDAEVHEPGHAADLQARTWAELANAHRIAGDLPKAERLMTQAVTCRTRGTGDPRLLARISDLAASLAGSQRRFEEAFRLLDIAYTIYQRLNDAHAAGRILIARGLYAGYNGDPVEGIRFLVHGLGTIDRARDPKLAFQALHNIVLLRVELGEHEPARNTLRQMKPLYDRFLSDLERVKLRWVEGKIAAGLGELNAAEAAFLQAKKDFDQAGLGYRAALVSLDLVAVWLRQGRTPEIRQLVAELLATFQAVGVEREALAGVLLLRDAVECEQASVELLQLIAVSLGRLDRRAAPLTDSEVR